MKGLRFLCSLSASLLLSIAVFPWNAAMAQWLQPSSDPSLSRNLAPEWGAAYAGTNYPVIKNEGFGPEGGPEPPPGMFPLYSSYFGPTNQEAYLRAVAVTATSEIFVAGTVFAVLGGPNLPCANAYNGGTTDGILAKFAADRRTLLYCVYIGTGGYDEINAIALDSAGNAYVAGYANDFFASSGRADGFVVKIAQQGADLVITPDYFGGVDTLERGDDRATDIAVAPNGSIVVVGYTDATDFPRVNAFDATLGGPRDGFIRRYNSTFTQVLNSTYAGYNNITSDELSTVDIGADNAITVAGNTKGFDALAREHGWAARYSAALNAQLWSRAYAGNFEEKIFDVRVLANGKSWIVGATGSSDFVSISGCTGGLDTSFASDNALEGFIVRLGTNGLPDGYCSFLGGPGVQSANSVDVTENGDVVVVGWTQPGDILSQSSFIVRLNGPNYLNMDYTLTYGTAASPDQALRVVRPPNKAVYVVGAVSNSGFWPLTTDAFQGEPGRAGDKGYYTIWFHDEDFPGRVRFPAATVSVDEAVGTLNLEVERVLGAAGTVTVDYSVMHVSTNAQDYTVSNGTLSFGPGIKSRPIPIGIVNDALDEDNETFKVTLSNPTGGAILGFPPEVVVTITDNDNPPTLNLTGCSVNEGNSGGPVNCTFVARLTALSGKDVTFRTSTANGSGNAAMAPSDYTAHANVTRTIPKGTQQIMIDVPVIADTTVETDENFRLSYDQLANATAGTTTATGTIVNDDSAPPVNNAAFVSQTVPSVMYTGVTYPVSITLRNTGTTTWTPANYRLGSQNPQNNTNWDADGRIPLPSSVAPNATVTFSFNVVAPPTGGSYNFQWRMLQDNATWFGATTTNVAVIVIVDRVFAGNFSAP